ncbi:SDR family oxidoreductase [Pelagibacterales bacterium SAG-MED23]|nr:SDR family oxidoreductase [Pelagibacterales bacterium SAG-MED23]
MSVFELRKKKILITGALGIIGTALTKKLIQNKNELILIDYQPKNKNEKFYSKFLKHEIHNLDIADTKKVKQFFSKNKRNLMGLNTVVNLAAIDAKADKEKFKKHFHNFPLQKIRKSISVNLTGLINICQESCKIFIKKNLYGNIINVGSTYSLVAPNINLYKTKNNLETFNKPFDYVITKSSIPILTKYIATTYAKDKIRCNCLIPHAILEKPSKEFLRNFKKLSPIGRVCKVDEIINPIFFLISDGSSYMTGSTVVVDGGWTAW